jgi:hypothetical protein
MSRREQKPWSWILTRLKNKNYCAVRDQQQFDQPNNQSSRLATQLPSNKDVSMEAAEPLLSAAVA